MRRQFRPGDLLPLPAALLASVSLLMPGVAEGRKIRSTVMSLDLEAEVTPLAPFEGLALALCPVSSTRQLGGRVRDYDLAAEGLSPAEADSLVGLWFNVRDEITQRFLFDGSLEGFVQGAVVGELEKLGARVRLAEQAQPACQQPGSPGQPGHGATPGGSLSLSVILRDFYFEVEDYLKPEHGGGGASYNFRSELRGSIRLDISLVDLRAARLIWNGVVAAGDPTMGRRVKGKQAVAAEVSRLLRDLLEAAFRNNHELLQLLPPGVLDSPISPAPVPRQGSSPGS
jgi:hypothetical protein